MYEEILTRAIILATHAHSGQTDKKEEPYILHPTAVMNLVQGETKTESQILRIVAVLHDVIEDTKYTPEEIARFIFKDTDTRDVNEYARLMMTFIDPLTMLSHDKDIKYEDYIRDIAYNRTATKVKLADITHNISIERMEHLSINEQNRLAKKYKNALMILKELTTMDYVIQKQIDSILKTGTISYKIGQ